MKMIRLNDGRQIPEIGFGVFLTKDGQQTENAVRWALEAGYRHIDTAAIYGNEASVGRAVEESGVPRGEIFLTTKLWNDDIRAKATEKALEESLGKLRTDYVDLYLIHWPVEHRELAWKEMERLAGEGKIRTIGVSNYQIRHLEELEKTCSIVPAVNQIESNPYFLNQELIDYCKDRNIQVEVWSPLGGSGSAGIREDETIREIGRKYGKTATQTIIRWHLQRGLIVLPKSTHENYIRENLDVYDFELSQEDMERISGLNRNVRSGSDPDNFDF